MPEMHAATGSPFRHPLRRMSLLAAAFATCAGGYAPVRADDAGAQPPVVTVTGKVYRDLRPYAHYAPGLREFRQHHDLAPDADLRFGLTSDFSGKLLPLKHARIVENSLVSRFSVDLPLPEEGWFTIPGPENAAYMGADIEVSWRGKGTPMWALEVHTPNLPYRFYRLGDLRLECRVYLAIEWALKRGTVVMGQPRRPAMRARPMDTYCGGPESVFVNTQPWPKLEAYAISEGGRSAHHELSRPLLHQAFELDLRQAKGAPPWSNDAVVEFMFADKSRWQPVQTVDP